jgi:hypothetical protein
VNVKVEVNAKVRRRSTAVDCCRENPQPSSRAFTVPASERGTDEAGGVGHRGGDVVLWCCAVNVAVAVVVVASEGCDVVGVCYGLNNERLDGRERQRE